MAFNVRAVMLTKTADCAAFGAKYRHADRHYFKTFCASFFFLL